MLDASRAELAEARGPWWRRWIISYVPGLWPQEKSGYEDALFGDDDNNNALLKHILWQSKHKGNKAGRYRKIEQYMHLAAIVLSGLASILAANRILPAIITALIAALPALIETIIIQFRFSARSVCLRDNSLELETLWMEVKYEGLSAQVLRAKYIQLRKKNMDCFIKAGILAASSTALRDESVRS
jgi:hypothetical protein